MPFRSFWATLYINPLPPGGGGGHGPLCPFSYASDSGVARNIQQGAKGVSPSQGREIYENVCIKMALLGVGYMYV